MEAQSDIVIAGRNNLRGAVSAFNAAWIASKGEYIANFNDDAVYLNDALFKGIDLLRSDPKIGQVSLMSNDCAPGGLAYSNFGISPRAVVEKVCAKQGGPKNYWNPIYYTYAGDYEYSAWIWNLGLEVVVMPGKWVNDLADTRDFLHRRNLTITLARLEGQLLLSRCSSKEKILTTGPG
jgi:glycosyltransferase involved in cell wall biosynthesis